MISVNLCDTFTLINDILYIIFSNGSLDKTELSKASPNHQ